MGYFRGMFVIPNIGQTWEEAHKERRREHNRKNKKEQREREKEKENILSQVHVRGK